MMDDDSRRANDKPTIASHRITSHHITPHYNTTRVHKNTQNHMNKTPTHRQKRVTNSGNNQHHETTTTTNTEEGRKDKYKSILSKKASFLPASMETMTYFTSSLYIYTYIYTHIHIYIDQLFHNSSCFSSVSFVSSSKLEKTLLRFTEANPTMRLVFPSTAR